MVRTIKTSAVGRKTSAARLYSMTVVYSICPVMAGELHEAFEALYRRYTDAKKDANTAGFEGGLWVRQALENEGFSGRPEYVWQKGVLYYGGVPIRYSGSLQPDSLSLRMDLRPL